MSTVLAIVAGEPGEDGRLDAYGYYVRDLKEWTERVTLAASTARAGTPDPRGGRT